MKRIDVADIALGACNFAVASAQCGAVGMSSSAADAAVRLLVGALAKKNITINIEEPVERSVSDSMREMIIPMALRTIGLAEEAVRTAELPSRFANKVERVRAALNGSDCNMSVASALLMEVVHDLIDELSEPVFLLIHPSKRRLYESEQPPFGPVVESSFPDSSKDVAAAARCLALDEWTACVFHLMRALESPLHKCSNKIGVTFPSPMDLENWKNIIDKLERVVNERVKEQEAAKRSHERNEELKTLGEIALSFRHFKNAWRNDAAHGRRSYDEREAQEVYDGTRSFMQLMAEAV